VTALFQWFFNVIVGLIPVIFILLAVWMFDLDTRWFRILRGGELFVFSTTFGASSISIRVFESRPIDDGVSMAMVALVLVMLMSSFAFALSAYMQLQQQSLSDRIMLRISSTSMGCALLTVVLGYIISI